MPFTNNYDINYVLWHAANSNEGTTDTATSDDTLDPIFSKVNYEKRMFAFKDNHKIKYYTYDMLMKEPLDWLKNICSSLNVGVLSTLFFI